MAFPIKTCVACGEEFELKPDKPGYANRCLECSVPSDTVTNKQKVSAEERSSNKEANEARRAAIRDLLYTRK